MTTAQIVDVSTRKYRTLNPANDELIKQFPTLSDDEAEAALARAHEAYQTWHRTPVEERVQLFRRFVEVTTARREELARQMTIEMGKPLSHSQAEVGMVLEIFEYFIEHGPAMLEPTPTEVPASARSSPSASRSVSSWASSHGTGRSIRPCVPPRPT